MREFFEIEKSFELVTANSLAMDLTFNRNLKSIGIPEFFSGLYLVDRELLATYWTDRRALDIFVRTVCGLTEPTWFYWIEYHESMKSLRNEGVVFPYAPDLIAVLIASTQAARFEAKKSRRNAIIGVEHFLDALISQEHSDFQTKLMASGPDVRRFRRI